MMKHDSIISNKNGDDYQDSILEGNKQVDDSQERKQMKELSKNRLKIFPVVIYKSKGGR